MDDSTTVLAAVLVLLGYTFIHITCAVLGHRLRTQVRRHDILVEVHRRRHGYHTAATGRDANHRPAGDVIIEGPGEDTAPQQG